MSTRTVSAVAVLLCSSLAAGCSEELVPDGPLPGDATSSGSVASAPLPEESWAPRAGPRAGGRVSIGASRSSAASSGDPAVITDPVLTPAPDPTPDPTPEPGPDPAPDPPVDPPVIEPDPPPVDPYAGAGPRPTVTCSVVKNGSGFFTRASAKSAYVAYVPASYAGSAPARLIVGLHGCGDSAANFAAWGINPYDTRASQDHIGISIGGKDGQCWSASDDDKVLAAVDDIASCFWVHQKKVVIAGYSSGGISAYRVGLKNALRFAGIIIESSGLYGTGAVDSLLANASWKLNIAHRTHSSDTVFPLAKVQVDWDKTSAAGFPLVTSITAGTHDGTSADWAEWLVPQSAGFLAP